MKQKKIKGKVRVAIIGTGGISYPHANGILTHHKKVECTALCDVSEENLKARSKQLGGVRALFTDWRRMYAEAGDTIDAVDICLPHHLHASAILDAVAAGKHILCEKPMCMNLKQADKIVAAVKKAGITYMSAHNQLFMPVVQEAKKMIASGLIGKIKWIRSQECVELTEKVFKGRWRSKLKYQGGGELIDTGYHATYRLLYLCNAPVVGVRASLGRYKMEIEGEDTASVQVRFANGVIGEILTSWAFENPYGTHEVHIIGEKGQIFGSQNKLYYLPAGCTQPKLKRFEKVETFIAQMGHFVDCLRQGTRPLHSVEEGRAVLEIIRKAFEDARGWQKYAVKKVKGGSLA